MYVHTNVFTPLHVYNLTNGIVMSIITAQVSSSLPSQPVNHVGNALQLLQLQVGGLISVV